MLCKWGGVEFVNLDANVSVAINYEIARGEGGGRGWGELTEQPLFA